MTAVIIDKAIKDIHKLPDSVVLVGYVAGRAVAIDPVDGEDTELIHSTEEFGYIWGHGMYSGGCRMLARDILIHLWLTYEVADFLSATLSFYVLQYFADNFKATVKIKELFVDAFAENMKPLTHYYTVHEESNLVYTEISAPTGSVPAATSRIHEVSSATKVVTTAHGWRRVPDGSETLSDAEIQRMAAVEKLLNEL